MTMPLNEDVRDWLKRWQDMIAQGDYSRAKHLFAQDVTGFGTVAVRAEGIEELCRKQWENVWTRTWGFAFDTQAMRVWRDGHLVGAALEWISNGKDAVSGQPFTRHGRCTIIWRIEDDHLVALHTHFSLNPAPERFLPAVLQQPDGD